MSRDDSTHRDGQNKRDNRGKEAAACRITRGQFLGRLGAASAVMAAGGVSVLADPAQAAVYFYNSGTLDGYGTQTDGWDVIANDRPDGTTRDYAVNQVSSGPLRSSNWALRMEARYGDPDRGGRYHSEVHEYGAGERGSTRWYGWSTYIPGEWITDDKGVITQQVFGVRTADRRPQPVGFIAIEADRWFYYNNTDGPDGGNATRKVDLGPVVKAAWTDWVVQAKWSSGSDGFVKVWKYNNPTPKAQWTGPNCYANDEPFKLQLGCYASGWSDQGAPTGGEATTRALRQDEVRIGDANSSFDEIKPR